MEGLFVIPVDDYMDEIESLIGARDDALRRLGRCESELAVVRAERDDLWSRTQVAEA